MGQFFYMYPLIGILLTSQKFNTKNNKCNKNNVNNVYL